uniref:Uncharacterized protein n=1 Tax=Glossina palpalis gambiensis TaxID=67801 RepID=A0A1B0AMZ1_9MUSC
MFMHRKERVYGVVKYFKFAHTILTNGMDINKPIIKSKPKRKFDEGTKGHTISGPGRNVRRNESRPSKTFMGELVPDYCYTKIISTYRLKLNGYSVQRQQYIWRKGLAYLTECKARRAHTINSNSICMMRSNVCHRQDFTHKHVYKYAALNKYSPKCECLCTVLDESKSTETIDLGLIEEIQRDDD